MKRFGAAVLPLAVLAAHSASVAQTADAPLAPVIVVAGSGTVEVEPDHAVLVLGVEVQDSVAALAAREMDRRLAAVSDTLASLGFPWDSLPSARFAVTPVPRYGESLDRAPVYRAFSSVRVTVRELDRLPEVIMATLAAGANSVTGLDFRSEAEETARLDALTSAVASAERDARRLARAAGVELGEILEIRTSGTTSRRAGGYAELEAIRIRGVSAPGLEITPDRIPVEARVQITWSIR